MNSGEKTKVVNSLPASLSPDERAAYLMVLPKHVKKIVGDNELNKEELKIL